MNSENGFLVLESGEAFPGLWQGQERSQLAPIDRANKTSDELAAKVLALP